MLTLSTARPTAAQTTAKPPILQSQVFDAKTKEPVQFALLKLQTERTAVLANARGHFELEAPRKATTDTLVVEGLDYLTLLIPLTDHQLADSTLLLEKIPLIPEGGPLIGARISPRQLGSQAKNPGEGMIPGPRGAQFALLMQPSPKRQLGITRSVSFFMSENGFPKESFRICIYRADGPNHSPGTNLLADNIMVKAPGGGQ